MATKINNIQTESRKKLIKRYIDNINRIIKQYKKEIETDPNCIEFKENLDKMNKEKTGFLLRLADHDSVCSCMYIPIDEGVSNE